MKLTKKLKILYSLINDYVRPSSELELAIKNENLSKVNQAIKRILDSPCIDPNAKKYKGQYLHKNRAFTEALGYAIDLGNLKLAEAIIKNGCKEEILVEPENNPLYFAISLNKPDAVRLLIKYKFDCNASFYYKVVKRKKVRIKPIDFAIQQNCPEIVKLLIEYSEINKEEVLYTAVEENNLEIVKLLIQAGANPYTRIRKKPIIAPSKTLYINAMDLAINKGDTKILEFFEETLKQKN